MGLLPVLTAAAPLIGGALSAFGQASANKQSKASTIKQIKFQKQANLKAQKFSRHSAGRQMRFQSHMAKTEFQRGMKDMKRAGLNPLLAYQKGGAATPSGASASGVTSGGASYTARNTMADIPSSVANSISAMRTAAEIQNINSQTNLNAARSDTETAQQHSLNSNSALNLERLNTQTHTTEKERIQVEQAVSQLGILDNNWTSSELAAVKSAVLTTFYRSGAGKALLLVKELKGTPNPLALLAKKGK